MHGRCNMHGWCNRQACAGGVTANRCLHMVACCNSSYAWRGEQLPARELRRNSAFRDRWGHGVTKRSGRSDMTDMAHIYTSIYM